MTSSSALIAFRRPVAFLARACAWAGVLSLFVMMLATDWDILSRQLFASPLTGVFELVEVAVLATAMLGLPEAFLRDEQIRVDLIDGLLPPRALAAVKAAGLLLVILLLGLMAWQVWRPMLDARDFGDVKYDLGLPVWPLHGLIIFAFAASILACLAALAEAVFGPASERGT